MNGRELDALMADHTFRSELTSHREELPETLRRMGYSDDDLAAILRAYEEA